MSDSLNEAVALLNDLLSLSRTTTSLVNQPRLDAAIDALAVDALEDVERRLVQLGADAQAAADAATEAEAQADRNLLAQEEAAAQALVQDEDDQQQRDERHAAGVS